MNDVARGAWLKWRYDEGIPMLSPDSRARSLAAFEAGWRAHEAQAAVPRTLAELAAEQGVGPFDPAAWAALDLTDSERDEWLAAIQPPAITRLPGYVDLRARGDRLAEVLRLTESYLIARGGISNEYVGEVELIRAALADWPAAAVTEETAPPHPNQQRVRLPSGVSGTPWCDVHPHGCEAMGHG